MVLSNNKKWNAKKKQGNSPDRSSAYDRIGVFQCPPCPQTGRNQTTGPSWFARPSLPPLQPTRTSRSAAFNVSALMSEEIPPTNSFTPFSCADDGPAASKAEYLDGGGGVVYEDFGLKYGSEGIEGLVVRMLQSLGKSSEISWTVKIATFSFTIFY